MKNLINKLLIMLAAIVSFNIVCQAQTTLSPGDIVIVGFNMDNPDEFAFVCLVPISTGTIIRFTDTGWLSSGSFRTGEGGRTFTAASDYNAGDVIIYSGLGGQWADYSVAPVGGTFALNSGGEQIIAFQGSATSPVLITAINNNREGAAEVWQTNATNDETSAFPTFNLGARVPYDFPSYNNADFKIRFRTVVGSATVSRNDVAIDEVRIYTDAAYDVTYSMTTKAIAENGFDFTGPDAIGLQDRGAVNGAWCWTSTGTPTNDVNYTTGPPTGIACVYTEASSTSVGEEFTMTLTNAIDASDGVHVTFDYCINGRTGGHLYFEAFDGTTWNIIDDWDLNTFAQFIPSGKYAVAMAFLDEIDNKYYSGGANPDIDALRTAILNNKVVPESGANWTGNDVTRFDLSTLIPNPLPVELASFSAIIKDKSVVLNWKTETEVNNYGFEVQRSLHQDKWDVLGFVEGHGNSNSPKEYNFIDSEVNSAGTYSYRLKQIDNDGIYEFSKTIEVDFTSPISLELRQNYPNPFNPTTTISFTLPNSGLITLKVFNTLGEEVETLVNEYREAGIHTFTFNAEGHPSGMYLYRLSTNGFTETKKMLFMK